MNDDHDFPTDQSHLEAAVQAILAEPLPEDAVERVKVRAKTLAKLSTTTQTPQQTYPSLVQGWKISRHATRVFTVATALLVMVVGTTLFLDRSTGLAFAQVIEKVKAANSVQFTMSMRFFRGPETDSGMFLEGNQMRIEQFDGALIQVCDLDQKKALFMDSRRKLAQSSELNAQVAEAFANPIEHLRNAKSGDAESIGEEVLNGRRTKIFRLREAKFLGMKGPADTMIWVDVESDLPAKITVRDTDPKSKMEMHFEGFVWNHPLDAQLLSVDIPAGFESGIVMITPREQPAPPKATARDSPGVREDGILSRDRVAANILWGPHGSTITALMRDPESVPPQDQMIGELRHWDVATGKLLWKETVSGTVALAGTADGKVLATVVSDEIQLRERASGKVIRTWDAEKHVISLAFSPDGTTLAVGVSERVGRTNQYSGGIQFWDVERASLVRTIPQAKSTAFVKYSVDGKSLLSDSGDEGLRLWEVTSGKLIRIFPGRVADFSPDGNTVAVVSSGYQQIAKVELYNLVDGSLIKSLTGEQATDKSWLLRVSFSPDGRLLASADWDGTVIVWNVAIGNREVTFTETAGVHTAMFSPDGTTLATGSENKLLRLRKALGEITVPVK